MKKVLLFPAIFCLLAITSCYPPLYKTTVEERKNIDGVSYESSILVYRDYSKRLSIFNNRMDGKKGYNYYGFELVYEGSSWMFFEGIKIKIDNGDVISLGARKPSRTVLHSGGVRERLSMILRGDILQSLRKCNSLAIQITELVEIPPDGIAKIKEFLGELALEENSEEQISEEDSEEHVSEEGEQYNE
jgi:hypothetical protein